MPNAFARPGSLLQRGLPQRHIKARKNLLNRQTTAGNGSREPSVTKLPALMSPVLRSAGRPKKDIPEATMFFGRH